VITDTATYIPEGFRFRRKFHGDTGLGFPGERDQVTFVYTRPSDPTGLFYPLTVHVAGVGSLRLPGTEENPGRPVAIDGSAVRAVYHDGLWARGRGENERRFGTEVLHWDRSDLHSLTLALPDRTLAVRGPRSRGVDVDELARILASLL
jgi:hypothetical protein